MNNDYRRIFAYIIPYWRRLTLVLALSLVSTLLGLAQPYITKLLIDEALLRKDMQALTVVAALMVAVTVLGFALNIASSYRYVAVSATVLFDMRLSVYEHLQKLSPRFYTRTRLGEIVSRLGMIMHVENVSLLLYGREMHSPWAVAQWIDPALNPEKTIAAHVSSSSSQPRHIQ